MDNNNKNNKTKLDEHYRLEYDTHNVILVMEFPTGIINPKTNKEIIRNDEWFYVDFKSALNKYIVLKGKETVSDDVKSLIAKIDEAIDIVNNIKL